MKDRITWVFAASGLLVFQLCVSDLLFGDYFGGYRFARVLGAGLFGAASAALGAVVAQLIDWSTR